MKAIGSDGTVSDVGQVPQVKHYVTATISGGTPRLPCPPTRQRSYSASPWPSPATTARPPTTHSSGPSLWAAPPLSATMVYDDANNSDNGGEVLMPFGWSNTGISVSEMPKGLGGVGPFLTYVGFNPATFDLTTRALTQPQKCTVFNHIRLGMRHRWASRA